MRSDRRSMSETKSYKVTFYIPVHTVVDFDSAGRWSEITPDDAIANAIGYLYPEKLRQFLADDGLVLGDLNQQPHARAQLIGDG